MWWSWIENFLFQLYTRVVMRQHINILLYHDICWYCIYSHHSIIFSILIIVFVCRYQLRQYCIYTYILIHIIAVGSSNIVYCAFNCQVYNSSLETIFIYPNLPKLTNTHWTVLEINNHCWDGLIFYQVDILSTI